MESLKLLFPDFEDVPHNDTLMRLLSKIEVEEIEAALIAAVRRLIKNKKFARYLVDNHYPVAIDGTQKFTRNTLWGIESGILVEKRHGYQYEHAFSYNWNAMKGFHYLMRLGRFINVLATYSECLVKMVCEFGVRGFIKFIRDTLTGRWLDPQLVKQRLEANFQLRLI